MLESNLKNDYTPQAQSDSPPAKGEYPKGEGGFFIVNPALILLTLLLEFQSEPYLLLTSG